MPSLDTIRGIKDKLNELKAAHQTARRPLAEKLIELKAKRATLLWRSTEPGVTPEERARRKELADAIWSDE